MQVQGDACHVTCPVVLCGQGMKRDAAIKSDIIITKKSRHSLAVSSKKRKEDPGGNGDVNNNSARDALPRAAKEVRRE